MSLIPDSKTGKVAFFQTKIAPWTTNAVAIGTSAAAVTDLGTKVTAAQDKIADQNAAFEAYRTAVMTANNAVRTMEAAGSDIIKQIRTKAALDGNTVYELAEIPAPAIPTPVPPPGMPTHFTAALNPNGSLTLKWKCANPPGGGGTIYQIARQIGGGAMTPLGVSGTRTYTDSTLPAGAGEVIYQIQAVRSTALGVAAEFLVRLGTSASGAATASVSPRLAA